MIEIAPYEKAHQRDVDEIMNEIASEFDEQIFAKQTNETRTVLDRYWVALNNKKVIGTVGVIVIENKFGILKKMMLQKSFRGKEFGVSTLLMETVINWCKQNDIPKIYIGTMNQFKAAQLFYKKNGFKRIPEKELPNNFINNSLDKVFFEQNLKPNVH